MSETANKAVFLSYASQDAGAARRICEALRAAGVEVWFDQSELVGGDAWDQKIRRQIKECTLLIPVISKATQGRREAYFRLEWKLADERTHLMAKGTPFLLPVTIDETCDRDALVPDSFLAVQWTKLPGGETPGAFTMRVGKLLGGTAMEPGRLRPAERAASGSGASPINPSVGRRLPAAAWVGAALLAVALGAGGFLWTRRPPAPERPDAGAGTRPPTAEKNSISSSAARKFTTQALALIDDPNFSRDNYRLADELCQRALTLDNSDAEIWASAALVSTDLISYDYDVSPQRRELARTQAECAFRLDPRSIRAGLARAKTQRLAGELPEAIRQLRELLQRVPTDRLVLRELARAERKNRNDAGVTEALTRIQALPGGDPLTVTIEIKNLRNLGRPREAETLVDQLLAGSPVRPAYYEKLLLLARSWSDLEAARRFLKDIPTSYLQEDAFASMTAQIWIWSGDGDRALQVLDKVPHAYLEEFGANEPKSYLAGWAHMVAGRSIAAQAEWQNALALVETRLATDKNGQDPLAMKATLQALLGQKEAARRTMKLCIELGGAGHLVLPIVAAQFQVLVGEPEAAIDLLEREWSAQDVWVRDYYFSLLRYSPAFAPIRGDTRVQQIISGQVATIDLRRRDQRGAARLVGVDTTKVDPKSVAVLPFANLSGDPSQEYFSDGLTEEILNALARERDLRVVPRTSAFSFKGKNLPLPEIARALNVAQVVEGSVQRVGNSVRIRCTFTHVADGFAEALPNFDRELKDGRDIFTLEDEVATAVLEKLTHRSKTSVPVAVLTQNSAAYDAFLRGRALAAKTSPSWPQALVEFQRAVELDPQFAQGWAELGELSASLYTYGFSSTARTTSEGAVEKALRLQPDLPEAHLARAYYLRATNAAPDVVEDELKVAERSRPNDPDIIEFRGYQDFALGEDERGLEALQRVVVLDPQNGARINSLGNALVSTGRYPEAEAAYRKAFQILGSSIPLTNLARLYFAWKGDRPLATRTLDEEPEQVRDDRYWTSRALLLYAIGDQPAALVAAAHMRPQSEFFRIRAFFTAKMREAMGDEVGAQRDYQAALPLAEQQRDQFPALATPYAILGMNYAALGRRQEALAATEKGVENGRPATAPGTPESGLMRNGTNAFTLVDTELDSAAALAQVEARFGKLDEALAIVRTRAAAGQWRRNYLLLNPDWAILRKDPRFRAIAEKARP